MHNYFKRLQTEGAISVQFFYETPCMSPTVFIQITTINNILNKI